MAESVKEGSKRTFFQYCSAISSFIALICIAIIYLAGSTNSPIPGTHYVRYYLTTNSRIADVNLWNICWGDVASSDYTCSKWQPSIDHNTVAVAALYLVDWTTIDPNTETTPTAGFVWVVYTLGIIAVAVAGLVELTNLVGPRPVLVMVALAVEAFAGLILFMASTTATVIADKTISQANADVSHPASAERGIAWLALTWVATLLMVAAILFRLFAGFMTKKKDAAKPADPAEVMEMELLKAAEAEANAMAAAARLDSAAPGSIWPRPFADAYFPSPDAYGSWPNGPHAPVPRRKPVPVR